MTVAYVLEQNASVSSEGERLLIKKEGNVLHTLHLFKLDQLVLFGNVSITPAAISHLLRLEVDTVFMSRQGRYRGRLQPAYSKNITLRVEQFKKMGEEDFCLRTASSVVAGKLANMRTVLLRLNRTREGLNLENQILSLKQLARKAAETESLDSLMGLEGRGSVLYFEGLSRGFLAEGVEFKKRVRRPPTDPVNALLSLGYTLLFNTVMAGVSLVGLDPYLGCLHSVEYGRPSLALDLMEEWRAVIVDTLVLSVFNLKVIGLEEFVSGEIPGEELEEEGKDPLENADEQKEGPQDAPPPLPVKLTDDGFRKFITQYERKMNQKVTFHLTNQQFTYRDCIREQIRHFARYVRGEERSYQPMPLR